MATAGIDQKHMLQHIESAHSDEQPTTITDRLFDELRQILDEEPGRASPFRSYIDSAQDFIPQQRGRTAARKTDFANMVGKKSGRALLREEGEQLF